MSGVLGGMMAFKIAYKDECLLIMSTKCVILKRSLLLLLLLSVSKSVVMIIPSYLI